MYSIYGWLFNLFFHQNDVGPEKSVFMIQDKCTRCGKDKDPEELEDHPCPYSEEMGVDPTEECYLCNCCFDCAGECAMDI